MNSNKYYYNNGKIKLEEYNLNNKLHNEKGPTYISYYKNGKIKYEYYCLNGKEYDKEMYYRMIKFLPFA